MFIRRPSCPCIWLIFNASLWLLPLVLVHAGERTVPTQEEIQHWLTTNLATPPLFKEGDILTRKDLARGQPFLPPGYVEEFDFADVALHVSPSGNYIPHADYMAATEKFLDQTQLAPSGALENYVAGRPFSQDRISREDLRSGLKHGNCLSGDHCA